MMLRIGSAFDRQDGPGWHDSNPERERSAPRDAPDIQSPAHIRRIAMKLTPALVIASCVLGSALVLAQAGGQAPPPPETTAPDIPGVVKGGTRVQLVKAGFN